MILTLPLAYAAAKDAANRQMKAAGRKVWNQADYNLSCRTIDRLWDFRRHCPKATRPSRKQTCHLTAPQSSS